MYPERETVNLVLTGTTLNIYRHLVTLDRPVGAREVQRALGLSSPAVATFHLEKLERNGLITKEEGGYFVIDKVYLKHYFLLRRRLIPRYSFYATLSTIFFVGWLVALFLGPSGSQFSSQSAVYVYVYGIITTAALCGFFWYETMLVLRNEKI